MLNVEIDNGSGFCFGVTTAIRKAEEQLTDGKTLYCLGDIVHNGIECERLRDRGLITIGHDELQSLKDTRVLLRAHGEPPSTYHIAEENNVEIIDATCPVVLALQRRIRNNYLACPDSLVIIFGKKGHAEVLGLVGQTDGNAIVVETIDELQQLDRSVNLLNSSTTPVYLYSQTTKSLDEFHAVINYCKSHISVERSFSFFDTICRQVANRLDNIRNFATNHDVILFVSGRKSSNGKVLFNECAKVNPKSYHIESPDEINPAWLTDATSVGICGATSTPKWLMEQCKDKIENKGINNKL